jgi:hypothetical protein
MSLDFLPIIIITLIILLILWRVLSRASNKRQKIILTSVLVTLGLISTQVINFDLRFRFLLMLGAGSFILTFWALLEGFMEGNTRQKRLIPFNIAKAIILLILPTFFTLAVASFYFLLPVRWLTRIPVAIGFGLIFYLLLLAQNIFSIASIRTIPLYRAASTLSLVCTILTAFLIFVVVHSFDLLFVWNGLIIFILGFLLTMQMLWTVEMEEIPSKKLLLQSLIISLCLGEVALSLSFWPLNHIMWSLLLTSIMYSLLGVATHFMRGKLTSRIGWEYVTVSGFFLLVAFFTTSWIG